MGACIRKNTVSNALIHYKALEETLSPLIAQVTQHTVTNAIRNERAIRYFIERDVFAEWGFFCLLKAFYRHLVCTDILWQPPVDLLGAALLHSILGDFEVDYNCVTQRPINHFNWYLEAMKICGANTRGITGFLTHLRNASEKDSSPLTAEAYQSVCLSLLHADVPEPAQDFVRQTFAIITQPLPVIAGAFIFGREAITSHIFVRLISQLQQFDGTADGPTHLLQQYFQRHVILDQDNHFPKAMQLLMRLCGTDEKSWRLAHDGAQHALQARIDLLDRIEAGLRDNSK